MTTKCYLDDPYKARSRHYLTLRKGQYWGHHVDLVCSYCGLAVTALKADATFPYNGPVTLNQQG